MQNCLKIQVKCFLSFAKLFFKICTIQYFFKHHSLRIVVVVCRFITDCGTLLHNGVKHFCIFGFAFQNTFYGLFVFLNAVTVTQSYETKLSYASIDSTFFRLFFLHFAPSKKTVNIIRQKGGKAHHHGIIRLIVRRGHSPQHNKHNIICGIAKRKIGITPEG